MRFQSCTGNIHLQQLAAERLFRRFMVHPVKLCTEGLAHGKFWESHMDSGLKRTERMHIFKRKRNITPKKRILANIQWRLGKHSHVSIENRKLLSLELETLDFEPLCEDAMVVLVVSFPWTEGLFGLCKFSLTQSLPCYSSGTKWIHWERITLYLPFHLYVFSYPSTCLPLSGVGILA